MTDVFLGFQKRETAQVLCFFVGLRHADSPPDMQVLPKSDAPWIAGLAKVRTSGFLDMDLKKKGAMWLVGHFVW